MSPKVPRFLSPKSPSELDGLGSTVKSQLLYEQFVSFKEFKKLREVDNIFDRY